MSNRRLPSDVGGTRLGAPIDRDDHPRAEWEVLVDAVQRAIRNKKLWRWDEGRRATEELGHEYYDRLGYYERRVLAMETLMVEHGMLTSDELDRRAAPLPRPAFPDASWPEPAAPAAGPDASTASAHPQPAFRAGDRVRVRDWWPPGHVRTPSYVRGRIGRVTAVSGPFRNPETLAYAGSGLPPKWLYAVEFRQRDLWEDYTGGADDVLVMDIYEHWIEPVEDR